MLQFRINLTIILIILLCAFPLSSDAENLPTDFSWRTITTPHFRVHHTGEYAELAKRIAHLAEEIHEELKKEGWTPWRRTDILMTDHIQTANAFSSAWPHNRIVLYLSRPGEDSLLNSYRSWLRLVLTHEYTHTLNLDAIRGIPAITRYFPGRVYFINYLQPIWIIEGNAVYNESLEGYGRNNSSRVDAIVRTRSLAGREPDISILSLYPREWPGGHAPYIYGGRLIEYLEKTRGRNTFTEIFRVQSRKIIPIGQNKNARSVYGTSYGRLYQEWKEKVRKEYRQQLEQLKEEGLTEAEVVSTPDEIPSHPVYGPDGSLHYVARSSYRETRLARISSAGKKEYRGELNDPFDLELDEEGRVYTSDMEFYRSNRLFYDLHSFREGRYRQITRGRRVREISVAAGKIALVIEKKYRYSIFLRDNRAENGRQLIPWTSLVPGSPALSPDGKKMAFTLRNREGYRKIVLMDLETGRMDILTPADGNSQEPAWHPEGDRIIFTSDRSGIFNLYEADLEKDRLYRFTRLVGGAHMPAWSHDGRFIAFQNMTADGPVISRIERPLPLNERDLETAPLHERDLAEADLPEVENAPTTGKKYNPLLSLWPVAIMPTWSFYSTDRSGFNHEIGFFLQGLDTLERYYWDFSFAGSTLWHNLIFQGTFIYRGLYPDLGLHYFDETLVSGVDPFPVVEKSSDSSRVFTRAGNAWVTIPFNRFRHRHALVFSWNLAHYLVDIWEAGVGQDELSLLLSGFQVSYSLSTTRLFTWSVVPERGRNLRFLGEIYRKETGSDYNFYRIGIGWTEHLPGFFPNNVFSLSFSGGAFIDRPGNLYGFDLGRYSIGYFGPVRENSFLSGQKGYPAGRVYGDYLARAGVSCTLPFIQKDAGYDSFFMAFRNFWGRLFAVYGGVWSGAPEIRDFHPTLGVELALDLTIGFSTDYTFKVGYAAGLTEPGEHQVYFSLAGWLKGVTGGLREPSTRPLYSEIIFNKK